MTSPQFHRKEKYSAPAPEDVTADAAYAVSISPSDEYQWFSDGSITNRLKLFVISALIRLKKIAGIDLLLFTEVSQGGRLHFHGYAKITSVPLFYLKGIRQLQKYGTYEIDTIKEREKWDVYCMKGVKYMDKIFAELDSFQFTNPMNYTSWEFKKKPHFNIYDWLTAPQLKKIDSAAKKEEATELGDDILDS